MNTPICDFVRTYAAQDKLRLHMPGHKGRPLLGFEALDLTEIEGADSLFEADGIIRESEQNAGCIFGAHTFYSTEGSSQAIRAMLALAARYAANQGEPPLILAARNAHKAFLSAVALLDLELSWLPSHPEDGYLSCRTTPKELEQAIRSSAHRPTAVYLTAPDYLGNLPDVAPLAEVCHRHGVLLLVDNAHGAYLKFLPQSRHPIDLGADACCDSAHKTLPALTGAAYLQISHNAPRTFAESAKDALALFCSTSPSYLILQSLDAVNAYLDDGYPTQLAAFLEQVNFKKAQLSAHGYTFCGDEPLKWTLAAKAYGYTGTELAARLAAHDVICEFSDPDYLVLMLTPALESDGLERLCHALLQTPQRALLSEQPPRLTPRNTVYGVRQALLSPADLIPIEEAEGRVLAAFGVACPPAVPIVVPGEQIDRNAIDAFRYYGIKTCRVIR